jgi:hypothetical protein
MEYINLKIQSLFDSVKSVCDKAIKDGVPEYAVLLILEKTAEKYVQPMIQSKMKEELEMYTKESKKAKPKSGPVVTDLPLNEKEGG